MKIAQIPRHISCANKKHPGKFYRGVCHITKIYSTTTTLRPSSSGLYGSGVFTPSTIYKKR